MPVRVLLQRLLLGCWIGLALVLSAPLVFGTNASIGLWLMQIVPLPLTLPGLRRRQPRALQWLGFLVLFYFTHGVLQAASTLPMQRWLGILTLLLCVTLFAAVIVTLRIDRQRAPHATRTE